MAKFWDFNIFSLQFYHKNCKISLSKWTNQPVRPRTSEATSSGTGASQRRGQSCSWRKSLECMVSTYWCPCRRRTISMSTGATHCFIQHKRSECGATLPLFALSTSCGIGTVPARRFATTALFNGALCGLSGETRTEKSMRVWSRNRFGSGARILMMSRTHLQSVIVTANGVRG